MRIQVLSDLHVNQDRLIGRELPEVGPEVDVLVLAGDTIDRETLFNAKFIAWLEAIPCPILFILGNHEYDGFLSVEEVLPMYKKILPQLNKNLVVLEDECVVIEGITFVGSTLFSELSPLGEARMRQFLNSYHMPMDLTGYWWNKKFEKSADYIELVKSDKTVIITHFGPSFQSCHPQYAEMASNVYFFSDLDELIHDKQPLLWIHGHTHSSSDYMIGDTRVICNPHGYSWARGETENRNGFNPNLIVEI